MNLFGWLKFAQHCSDALRDERQRGESLVDCLNRTIEEAKQWRSLGTSKPEPKPQNEDGPAVWPIVIAHLQEQSDPIFALIAKDAAERHEFGVNKYGVALVARNGRNHLKDAYQEQLDKIVYLRAHYELTGYGYHAYAASLDEAAEMRRALEEP